jgi:phage baseplate assembly protein W
MPSYSMNSVVNTSAVSSVTQSSTSYPSSVVNDSTFGAVGVKTTSSVTSVSNTSSVTDFVVVRRDTYAINSVSNVSSVGDIRRVGVIGFDSIKNTSIVSSFVAKHASTIDLASISNTSLVGGVQAFVKPIVSSSFTPITRPVKTIPTAVTGFKKFTFRDIALKGGSHPLTGDLLSVTDSAAVGQSLKNIVLTNKTERFFDDIEFGVGIESYLFELYGEDLRSRIEESIISQVAAHEPRAIILGVTLNANPAQNQLGIVIKYKIKTTNVTDTVAITLERR